MMLARKLLRDGTSAPTPGVDPYWENVSFLLQVDPSTIDGTTDYEDAKGHTIIKCTSPVVGTTTGGEKCISFSGSNWLETPTSGVHMSPEASMYVMGALDMTYEFVLDFLPASTYAVFWSGSPGNGGTSSKQYLGGYNMVFVPNGRCFFVAGNFALHGSSRVYGKKTTNVCLGFGRNEIVYRIVSGQVEITANGVLQPLSQYDSWTLAASLDNVQCYIERNVCVNAHSKYNCAHDPLTVPIGSSSVAPAHNVVAMRVTRGVARDIQYQIQLPFPTS